jgi:hypothetical protein
MRAGQFCGATVVVDVLEVVVVGGNVVVVLDVVDVVVVDGGTVVVVVVVVVGCGTDCNV